MRSTSRPSPVPARWWTRVSWNSKGRPIERVGGDEEAEDSAEHRTRVACGVCSCYTTVQASRLLGVSRQFLVNLMDKGEIPHHMVGTHRRVYINDLMAFKCRRDQRRRAVLNQMVQSEIEAGVYDVVPDDFSGQ